VIAIDDKLVSDDVVEAHFICDLLKCKGGCCEDGDAGAPVDLEEKQKLSEIYSKVEPYLTKEGKETIAQKGFTEYDTEFGWVTPTVKGTICAYGFRDSQGIIRCGIEKAWLDGKIDWQKPLSCHLFPIKTKHSNGYEMVNYEPREDLCRPACKLGEKEKLPVYQFLKSALIRKYGEEFYEALDAVAKDYFQAKNVKTKKKGS